MERETLTEGEVETELREGSAWTKAEVDDVDSTDTEGDGDDTDVDADDADADADDQDPS